MRVLLPFICRRGFFASLPCSEFYGGRASPAASIALRFARLACLIVCVRGCLLARRVTGAGLWGEGDFREVKLLLTEVGLSRCVLAADLGFERSKYGVSRVTVRGAL